MNEREEADQLTLFEVPADLELEADEQEEELAEQGHSNSRVGKWAEHFTMCALLKHGHDAHLVQGARFDVLVMSGGQPIRIQVKSTIGVMYEFASGKQKVYRFNLYTFGRRDKLLTYGDEVDIFAFVAADLERVVFMKASDAMAQTKAEFPRVQIPKSQFTADGCIMSLASAFKSLLPSND